VSATSSPFTAEGTELLRLVTCGSVDDGKSTLLGRLLFDSKQVMADQLEHVEATSERLPVEVEAAAYFVVCEAVTNAVKHGSPTHVSVEAIVTNGTLRLLVVEDGSGGARLADGTGLVGLTDRVEAQGGTLAIHSPPGAGTRIEVEIPCES